MSYRKLTHFLWAQTLTFCQTREISIVLFYSRPKIQCLYHIKRNLFTVIKTHQNGTALELHLRDRTVLGHNQCTLASSWRQATGIHFWVLFLIPLSNSISLVGPDLPLSHLYNGANKVTGHWILPQFHSSAVKRSNK